MAFALRCPKCRDRFPWVPADGMPDYCPLCKEFVGGDNDSAVVMPFIKNSAKVRAVEQVYRDMERGSEVRAAAAAEMMGVPVSEMSALKITDMKDNAKLGENSAPALPAGQASGEFFKPNGAEFAAGTASGAVTINGKVTTGVEPRAGARAMTNIQQLMRKS